MASNNSSSIALFLALNLIFFTLTTACGNGCGPAPKPKPKPSPSLPGKCPRDALKLGICANVLGNLLGLKLGNPPVKPCCSLIEGLVDLEAAACFCTALRANVLGIIKVNLGISLDLLLNVCGKKAPSGFRCH